MYLVKSVCIIHAKVNSGNVYVSCLHQLSFQILTMVGRVAPSTTASPAGAPTPSGPPGFETGNRRHLAVNHRHLGVYGGGPKIEDPQKILKDPCSQHFALRSIHFGVPPF